MSRRDYEEGYEEARRDMRERELGSSGGGDKGFTVAVIVKYVAIVIVVLIIAYVVLQFVNSLSGIL